MKPKLSFLDKLLGRKAKTVFEKDQHGKIVKQVRYSYDSYGEVVATSVSRVDKHSGMLVKYKDKTYIRREDGSYDPSQTTYYDRKGREITENQYYRDSDGMLFCDQEKYSYTNRGDRLKTQSSTTRYDGGMWTKIWVQENHHDNFGRVIAQENFKLSPYTQGLVRVKDKTFVRNADGSYDPKETAYYDLQGRLIKFKQYGREQVNLEGIEKSVLTANVKEYSYGKDGAQKEVSSEKSFRWGSVWVPDVTIGRLKQREQTRKQERIAQLESELAQLKGTTKSPVPPPRGKDGR